MRILFLSSTTPQPVAEAHGLPYSPMGGWIESIQKLCQANPFLIVGQCFPVSYVLNKTYINCTIDGVSYYSFHYPDSPIKYSKETRLRFERIIEAFAPDLVYLFGTEQIYSFELLRAFRSPERTVIHLQGLVSEIVSVYRLGIPSEWLQKHFPLSIGQSCSDRSLIRQIQSRLVNYLGKVNWFMSCLPCNSILLQEAEFRTRGKFECKAIKNAARVIGRTDWDKQCAEKIHPGVAYHYLAETLRDPFYDGEWRLETCEKHSLFISQASYPVKGLHFLLQALPLILKQYPDTKLRIAGTALSNNTWRSSRLGFGIYLEDSYAAYIQSLLECGNLYDRVSYCGLLSAEQMMEEYLKCHVFVLPSLLENESNALSEAKLLGVPVVASAVGGVVSRIVDQIDGLLYPSTDFAALAELICRIFRSDDLARSLSASARKNARILNNRKKNLEELNAFFRALE